MDTGTKLYDLANTLPDPDADLLREAADELARVTAERDEARRVAHKAEAGRRRLKSARDGSYFHEASEADMRAALSRLSYAAGVYYEADHASAPAHPSDLADVLEGWLKSTSDRADRAEARLAAVLAECDADRLAAKLSYFDPGGEWAAGAMEMAKRIRSAATGVEGE